MTGKTHMVGGVLAAVLHNSIFEQQEVSLDNLEFLAFVGASVIGSLLADIDHPKSTIGRLFRWLSKPINKIFGRRTITHSILSVLLLLLPTAIFYLQENTYLANIFLGLTVGHVSHLLLDLLNLKGITLFYPSKKRISLNLIKVGSYSEIISNCAMIFYLVHLLTR